MPGDALPDHVRAFIATYVPSVLQLELILHLFEARPNYLTLGNLSKALGVDSGVLSEQLAQLQRQGLVSMQTPNIAYGYLSSPGQQDNTIGDLAAAYRDRRVSVIAFIYSQPADRLRSFADAFRLRGDQKESPDE